MTRSHQGKIWSRISFSSQTIRLSYHEEEREQEEWNVGMMEGWKKKFKNLGIGGLLKMEGWTALPVPRPGRDREARRDWPWILLLLRNRCESFEAKRLDIRSGPGGRVGLYFRIRSSVMIPHH